MLLSRAKKSRIVDHALIAFSADETVREIPAAALDKHTKRGRAMGRGWEHFWADGSLLADPETGELTAEGSLPDVTGPGRLPRHDAGSRSRNVR